MEKATIVHLADGRFIFNKQKDLCLTTVSEVVCRRFLHESINYPRKGYKNEDAPKYTIPPNTKVKILDIWSNFVDGTLVSVEYNGISMDILPKDLKYAKDREVQS